jgi:predicted DNA-binding protein YlxM (UPF0122 family)
MVAAEGGAVMARGMTYRLPADEQALILDWSRQGISLAEQARRLNRPATNLMATYRRYVRAGLLPRRTRGRWRRWTPKETAYLKKLLADGYSYDEIARILKRSRTSIILKATRRTGRLTTVGTTWSARDVAHLLGIGCAKTVSRWIQWGWLPARNGGGAGQQPLWRIQKADLYTFLSNRMYWMAWQPERITNDSMRAWAMDLRRNQPRWLSVGEVADRYSVTPTAVGNWIRKGYLPTARYGNHWIWEADLVGWQPPCDVDRRVWRQHRRQLLQRRAA